MSPSTAEQLTEANGFDPFDPRWNSDPSSLYAELREQSAVHSNEMGFRVMTRHSDCLAMLRDQRVSSDSMHIEQGGAPEMFRRPISGESPMAAGMAEMAPFLFRDPPDHTRLRGMVTKAFTPKVIESLQGRTQEIVDELLDKVVEAGEVDLLTEFAYPLPVRAICDLLGVPAADQDLFKGWSEALARGLDPDILLPDKVIEARGEAVIQFAQYFFELLNDRRKHPGDDLLSRLVLVQESGVELTETELLSTCILLLVAGHETTVNLIAGGVLALLRNPDQLERFRSDPDVHRTGIEEMVRFVSPVQLTARSLTEAAEFGGVEFEAGDFVFLLLASANHDPRVFDDPETFDISRAPNNHLGFGFGIHHCLGAPLARMETQLAISSLLQRAPKLSLASDRITFRGNVVSRGLSSLPVSVRS